MAGKQLLLIVGALEEQFSIPVVAAQQELILEIQTDHWWEGVTVPLLELVRLRLRNLVQHIKYQGRPVTIDAQGILAAHRAGDKPQHIAKRFNVARSSVYRVIGAGL